MPVNITAFEQEKWFKITNHHLMRPFLMSVVSPSNHWMFIASNGGLTAGRKNPQYALFPYYTDDKLTELADTTGSKTILRIAANGNVYLWEPFSDRNNDRHTITRNLYKNLQGNKVMFEEINQSLALTFQYRWTTGDEFGFIKIAELLNHSDNDYHITVLDGLQNVMPYGINSQLQMTTSNLADAYKRTELVKHSGLAIFALSAIIVDKAEPSEALKANLAWSLGLPNPTYLLSSLQLNNFRNNQPIQEEYDVKGEKGAYFIHAELHLPANTSKNWKIIANVNQNQAQVIALNHRIQSNENLNRLIEADIAAADQQLQQLVAAADGLHFTADTLKDARHYANVLFNIMRGGIFDQNYQIDKADFVAYLAGANKLLYQQNQPFVNALKPSFDKFELDNLLQQYNNPHLIRLAKEYLPLKFSRRHGDPSRPWNYFSINTTNELDGSKVLDYEGNWRDIFQNWEALAHAYPDFVEGMIFKFLNASTFDGYNPYRLTKGGFDWETIEHDNPWSYIGYWGDHQIIYLLKFLEFFYQHKPAALVNLFNHNYFVYANVPYKIKPYADILKDPKNTIDFDETADKAIRQKTIQMGADGALLSNSQNNIHRVTFLEKILATILAKIANFIPEAGIWMNTQRPEWNDANNALVGNGVSMVTLYYLRRFLKFFESVLPHSPVSGIQVSEELHHYFTAIAAALHTNEHLLNGNINNQARKKLTDALGQAAGNYRTTIYNAGFSGQVTLLNLSAIANFLQVALRFVEHAIKANRRPDHLYHAYNLITISDSEIAVSHLEEMLEGQVAVISSGFLTPDETLQLLHSLRNSQLYRPDQNSYLLYPNKKLPGFLQKNNIPSELVQQSELLQRLMEHQNFQIINHDIEGGYHFNGNFNNAADVKTALANLPPTYEPLVKKETQTILNIFESVFNHKAFTGRSGTFFAYEGLGSIYWHMVSKLHLAVQEACLSALKLQADTVVVNAIIEHYYQIAEGIGVHKDPQLYGAFPTDPYSHTPLHKGAQQPGMTGQVKEDILVSLGELGVAVNNGRLHFEPRLLRKKEFLDQAQTIYYINTRQELLPLTLEPNSICFTYCQTPVIYQLSDKTALEITYTDGSTATNNNTTLDEQTAMHIFQRTNAVKKITVFIPQTQLR
ncbi:MAG TPA: hypothetical protein PK239_01670 [Chitinophagales bacterium]|nr:hypothetical protein [Chitinophagales bacterium]